MTTEPPRGIKANMLSTFNMINDQSFINNKHDDITYGKLIYTLSFFMLLLLKEKNFLI